MKEYHVILQNLEKLRNSYGLLPEEVDKFANLKRGTYESAVVDGHQDLTVKELISIAKIYIPDPSKIFKQKMRLPAFRDLPEKIRNIATERLGKTDKIIEKKNSIYYAILVLNEHFNVGDDFTNSKIKSYLTTDLGLALKGKSIEWDKSIIADYILDTETTQSSKTRPEKIYRLIKTIPTELVTKAIKIVGEGWLESDQKTGDNSETKN